MPRVVIAAVSLAALCFGSDLQACRFWGLVGSGYPQTMIADHLRDGRVANLRDLGGENRDGWGFASFPSATGGLPLTGPIIRRGGPPANHPTDPSFNLAVRELIAMHPRAALGHVRAATSGHWGVPDPHPFQHDGAVFAHNGAIPEDKLVALLTADDPKYLDEHPPDWVNGYIDSELYFLYLLKVRHQHPGLSRAEALRKAVRDLDALAPQHRLNFVLTTGDTLFALRCAPADKQDAVRYGPVTGPASPYWFVASQVLGSSRREWGYLPARSLAVFVPGEPPAFLPIDEGEEPAAREAGATAAARVVPNPTRDGITLTLPVPAGGATVAMEIWDAAGRLVWSSAPAWVDGGERRLAWDGRDRRGVPVPSGPYFCRTRVDGVVSEQRVTVLR